MALRRVVQIYVDDEGDILESIRRGAIVSVESGYYKKRALTWRELKKAVVNEVEYLVEKLQERPTNKETQ